MNEETLWESFRFRGRLGQFGVEPQINEHEKPKVSILQ
jgi:hypothetical protein